MQPFFSFQMSHEALYLREPEVKPPDKYWMDGQINRFFVKNIDRTTPDNNYNKCLTIGLLAGKMPLWNE